MNYIYVSTYVEYIPDFLMLSKIGLHYFAAIKFEIHSVRL